LAHHPDRDTTPRIRRGDLGVIAGPAVAAGLFAHAGRGTAVLVVAAFPAALSVASALLLVETRQPASPGPTRTRSYVAAPRRQVAARHRPPRKGIVDRQRRRRWDSNPAPPSFVV
jgi:hypothetical protein